jgi:hypothetical protein
MADDAEQPEDLRDTISRAFDEQVAKDVPARTDASETPAEVVETDAATDGRARGPDGKFVAKTAADDEPVEEAPSAEPEEAAAAPEAKPVSAEVPQHWSQADKDLVAALPAEHQAKVIERFKAIEAGFTPKLQRAAQIEREWAPAAEVFAPYMNQLRSAGQTPSDVVKAWAAIEIDLTQGLQDANSGRQNQRAAARVAGIISHYRIDPALIAEYLTNPQAARAPAINGGITSEVPAAVMQEIEGLKARERQREEAERSVRVMTAQQQIDSFAAEKDASGNLAHPYFQEVEATMDNLARANAAAGQPIVLADLYEQAVYANRDTRTKLLAAKEAEVKQQAAAERKAKALASQRAASSVTGSPGGGQAQRQPTGTRTLREELEAAFEDTQAA